MMRAMLMIPRPTRLAWLALAALAFVCPVEAAPKRPAAPALSPLEQRLAASVERHTPESLQLLQRAVDINSGTMNLPGVKATGELFAAEFERLGFKTRWIDGTSWQRAGHLIAEHGKRGPKVVLVGHLDTVFEPESPFQRYQLLDDSTAAGPGVTDMKGGNVIMLLALRALKENGALDRMRITVVLTGDEEKSGEPQALARADLLAAAEGATAAIGFEDGDGDPRHVVVARRGNTGWQLRVRGTPSHSSQIFSDAVGIGAILEAARVLQAFRDSLSFEPYLTFNPGLILGGTTISQEVLGSRGTAFGKSNVVAESTLVTGDLRTLTPEQLERAKAVMQRIVAEPAAGCADSIAFEDGYPPLPPTAGNRALLGMVDQASRDLGLGPLDAVDPARAGAADVSFLLGRVPRIIDAMGLKGSGGHTVQEKARLKSLGWQAKRTAVLISRLALEKPSAR
jgi:glutamate carboxypeptidase